jgi:hypothetical protein
MHGIFKRQYVSFLKTHQSATPTAKIGANNVLHQIKVKFIKLHNRPPKKFTPTKYTKKAIKKPIIRCQTARKIYTDAPNTCQLLNFATPKMSLNNPLTISSAFFKDQSDRSITKVGNINCSKESAMVINKKSFNASNLNKELDNSNQQDTDKTNLYSNCTPIQAISPNFKTERKQPNIYSNRLHLYTSYPSTAMALMLNNDFESEVNSLASNMHIEGIKTLIPVQAKNPFMKSNSANYNGVNAKTSKEELMDAIIPPTIIIAKEKLIQSAPYTSNVSKGRNVQATKLGTKGAHSQKDEAKLKENGAELLESAGVKAISKIDIRRKLSDKN